MGVEGAVGGSVGGADPEGAIAGGDGGLGALLEAHAALHAGNGAAGGVALAEVAGHAAEQGVDGAAEDLALNVPEGKIERAEGVDFFAAGRIEEGARHVLPETLDVLRVLADEAAGALLERVAGSALADSGDAGVGFDSDDHVALIEEGVWVGRRVDADARDLHFGEGGAGGLGAGGGHAGGEGGGFEERSTVHCLPVYRWRGGRREERSRQDAKHAKNKSSVGYNVLHSASRRKSK